MLNKLDIAKDWLPRYTGMPLDKFGENILLTNFSDYVENFSDRFNADVYGEKRPMQACTNSDGLTIINFGIGSPNAATIMDLLSASEPNGVLFLGKCGGLKDTSEIGNFVLPIAAIRGEGTSDNYFPSEVPAFGISGRSILEAKECTVAGSILIPSFEISRSSKSRKFNAPRPSVSPISESCSLMCF